MLVASLAFAAVLFASPQEPAVLALRVTPIEFDAGEHGRFPSLSASAQDTLHLCWFAPGTELGTTQLQHSVWRDKAWQPSTSLASGRDWLVNWADFAKYQEDAQGHAVASWQTFSADKRGYGVTRKLRAKVDGPWSAATSLHLDRAGVEHGFVAFAALGAGRFFATWLQSTATGPPTNLRYTILNVDGVPSEEFVLDDLVCDCCSTAAIALPSGEVVVAYRNRSTEEVRDLRVVRGNPADPNSWTAPTAVDKEGWKTQSCPVNGPALANDGNFISLVFYTEGATGMPQVKYLSSKDGGKSFGLPLPIAGGKTCLGRVAVAQLPAGGPAIVAWLEQSESGAHWVACAIPRSGQPSAVVPIAAVTGARADGFLQLAASANTVFAAWTSSNPAPTAVKLARIELK